MSFVNIWVHSVWTTKKRAPLLLQDGRVELFQHIIDNGETKGILVESVNGYLDHVHCLFRLKNDQTISWCVQQFKGESSHWANRNNIFPHRLSWQKEYYAVSVSESIVNTVRTYINNQEEHHRKVSWNQEYRDFIKKYNFRINR